MAQPLLTVLPREIRMKLLAIPALVATLSVGTRALADEPPAATAPDGEARGYEHPPEDPSGPVDTALRGAGAGAGAVARTLLLPVRGALYVEARWQVTRRVEDLVWNDARTFALYPTASYSGSGGAMIGVHSLYRDFLGHGETLSASADTGSNTPHALQLQLTMPRLAGSRVYLEARARHEEQQSVRFAGIGNGDAMSGTGLDARAAGIDTRFGQERLLGILKLGTVLGGPGRQLRLGGHAVYNDRSFAAAPDGGSVPSIDEVYDTATIDGFDGGVRTVELGLDVALDTRDNAGATGSGGLISAFAAAGGLVDDEHYARYGLELARYWTPLWPGRVFAARLLHEGIREIDGDVPFTELPRLGGSVLRGYSSGQFRDRLATVASLEYHYPIHANVSGELFVDAGKVAHTYGELGDGLTDDWHLGAGGGLLLHSTSSLKLRLDLAYGDGPQFFIGADLVDAFKDRESEL